MKPGPQCGVVEPEPATLPLVSAAESRLRCIRYLPLVAASPGYTLLDYLYTPALPPHAPPDAATLAALAHASIMLPAPVFPVPAR